MIADINIGVSTLPIIAYDIKHLFDIRILYHAVTRKRKQASKSFIIHQLFISYFHASDIYSNIKATPSVC